MAEATEPNTPTNLTPGEMPLLAGTLRHRWHVLAELESSPVFRKYTVEDTTARSQAVLIQRTYESRPVDLIAWKKEFLDFCVQRKAQNGGEPAVLDYFTQGDCLFLVQEAIPQNQNTFAGVPPSPPEAISTPPIAVPAVSSRAAPSVSAVIPASAPPPPPGLSRAQTIAITRAQDFMRGMDRWSRAFSPGGFVVGSFPVAIRLQRHLELFATAIDDRKLQAWIRQWYREAYNCCVAISDSMDTQADSSSLKQAQEEFQVLLPLANVEQIRPLFKGPFIPGDYNEVGTLASGDLSEPPGTVARVRTSGFRQNGRVRRKAEVLVFGPPALTLKAKPRNPSFPAILFSILLGFGLAALLFWWMGNTRKSPSPGTDRKSDESAVGRQAGPPTNPDTKKSLPIQPAGKVVVPSAPSVPDKKSGPVRVRIDQFTVTPEKLKAGQAFTVSWEVANATTVRITPGLDVVGSSGTKQVVPPPGTTAFVLQATGAGDGNSATAPRSVQIEPASARVVEFAGDHEQVAFGEPLRLRWRVSDATSVRIDPGPFVVDPEKGELTIPSVSTANEYKLTAVGPGGDDSAIWPIKVVPKILAFDAARFPDPQCEAAILRWTVKGASTISIDNGVGVVNALPYKRVRPLQTVTYTLTASGVGGSSVARTTVQGFRFNAACPQR